MSAAPGPSVHGCDVRVALEEGEYRVRVSHGPVVEVAFAADREALAELGRLLVEAAGDERALLDRPGDGGPRYVPVWETRLP